MKCWKCSRKVKLKKDGNIPNHNIRWGYNSHLHSPMLCNYSGRAGNEIIIDGEKYLQVTNKVRFERITEG